MCVENPAECLPLQLPEIFSSVGRNDTIEKSGKQATYLRYHTEVVITSLATWGEFEDKTVTADDRQLPTNPLDKTGSVNREPGKQLITIHSHLRSHECEKEAKTEDDSHPHGATGH